MRVLFKSGAYASHGHSIAAKGITAFSQIYKCDAYEADAWSIYINRTSAGAMRAYGIPSDNIRHGKPC